MPAEVQEDFLTVHRVYLHINFKNGLNLTEIIIKKGTFSHSFPAAECLTLWVVSNVAVGVFSFFLYILQCDI